jgi:hypothetical protein
VTCRRERCQWRDPRETSRPDAEAPSSLAASWRSRGTSFADEARRHFIERDGLSSQVRPSGGAGSDPAGARAALDYLEVRVRYSVP